MEAIKTDNIIQNTKYKNPKFTRTGAVLGGLAATAAVGADKFIKTGSLKPAGDKKTAAIAGAIIAGGTILGATIGKLIKNHVQKKLANQVFGELIKNIVKENDVPVQSIEDLEKYLNETPEE